MIESIPLVDIVAASVLAAPFVVVGVEMVKAIGLKGKRLTSAAAVLIGQAIVLGHWWVSWPHTPETAFLAVLVGIAASAMAMKLWDRALKMLAAKDEAPPIT